MIVPQINQLIATALKAHDEIRLSTLRLLSSAFNYERINLQHDLTEEEELNVVRNEAKKRKDSIEAYDNAKRQDLADRERKELAILQEFLPAQMSDEELAQIVNTTISELGATSMADMGKVIGAVVKKVQGKAEGGAIAALVKAKLS